MDNLVQNFHKMLTALLHSNTYLTILKSSEPYIKELQEMNFSFGNPVFGLIILIAFLIFSKIWDMKKAFSYCLLISSLLVLSSKINHYIKTNYGQSLFATADMLTFIVLIVIGFISVYYLFIKND